MKHAPLVRLLEQAKDLAAILIDRDGRIVDWLPGAASTFGYSADEMIGRTIDCLFTPEDIARGAPAAELATAARQGRAEDDRWMLRSGGTRFWASGFVHALRDSGSELTGFAKLLRDRTDQRAQIEALDNRAAALEVQNRELTLLLAKLAHELRNPLGVLANAARLVETAAGSEPKLRYAAELIARQTSHASELIEGLLELARANPAREAARREPVVLDRVLAEARETVEPRLRVNNVRVELLLAESPIVLEGDAARLRQVFVNLLDNAAKFSPPGGTIWVSATTGGGEAVVQVRDEGAGIPPDLLPRVFELFTQAESARRTGDGLGLGLAIVRENVELHRGTVQVRSEGAGRGAEFRVRLPLGSR